VGGLQLDEMRRLATIITNPLRYDVQTFTRSAQMSQRYAFLVSRFPDPSVELPGGEGGVAPAPDAPQPEASPPAAQQAGAPQRAVPSPAAPPSAPPSATQRSGAP
ncbi:MAG TPA: hypothetical protein VMQ10_14375, partial [Spirochaetia bacterium]|nr:hypothetical protein [Spirochaetia bacterium]